MKTRCPECLTTFRVSPEQLKARAGKVRCGQCQQVFNALDSMVDETHTGVQPAPRREVGSFTPAPAATEYRASYADHLPPPEPAPEAEAESTEHIDLDVVAPWQFQPVTEIPATELAPNEEPTLNETSAQELGKATGLIMPRETAEIPGYSKWSEGVMTAPISLPEEKKTRWPFVVAALLLIVALAGQLVFHFRSEIAVSAPSLRPLLEAFSQAIDSPLPLPSHVEQVSIETSDLQADPARGNLLVLNATLRNRAPYAQAYPSLELSLTDTHDAAIARRVFPPREYLSPKLPADQPFAANTDIAVRLWIEARDVSAAGYRLYVFYP